MEEFPQTTPEWRWRVAVLERMDRLAQLADAILQQQTTPRKEKAQPQADAAQGKPRRGGQRRVKKDESSTEQKDTTERRRRNAGRE